MTNAPPLILVVDDHADTRQLLVRVLIVTGYRAVAVADGLQGLLFLSENRPDLVILDRMMPGMDGMEVLRTMRQTPRDREVPVILYSAGTDAEQADEALRLGAQAYVSKGTGWETLLYQIERLVGRPQGVPDKAS
jgi:two-component system phosphate regulon response regulator PhoB